MKQINQGRWTAEIEGDFVVFPIGARVNRPLQALRSFRESSARSRIKSALADTP